MRWWWVAASVMSVGVSFAMRPPLGSAPDTGATLERALPTSPDLSKISLKVEKSAYRLTVLYDGKPVKEYPVVFGRNPVDDKLREGDGCTPEGTFRVKALYPHRAWSRFLWLDYPTARSWERFHAAKRSGRLPRNAKIGGEIGIHGVPSRDDSLIERRKNWTLGCVSMKTADVLEVYRYARVGMRVEIVR